MASGTRGLHWLRRTCPRPEQAPTTAQRYCQRPSSKATCRQFSTRLCRQRGPPSALGVPRRA
eukprot:6078209-Alexandrium_andersonii.AAC.1